jgi:hypothetical protein
VTKHRKKKAAAAPRKRAKKRKSAKRTTRTKRTKRAHSPKRRGTRLHIELTIPAAMRLDGPELAQLSDAQRLELASMGTKKRASAQPSWAGDERAWRKAARLMSSSWRRYEHPYAAVALVYLRSGGTVGRANHGGSNHAPTHHRAPPAGRRGRGGGGAGGVGGMVLEVERVDLDALGYDELGRYYGPGETLWRVISSPSSPTHVDTVVRARTAAAARSLVAEQYGH